MDTAMDIKVKVGSVDAEVCDLLVLFFSGTDDRGNLPADSRYASAIARVRELGDLTGAAGDLTWIYPPEGPAKRLLIVGLGRGPDEGTVEALRQAAGRAVQSARKSGARHVCVPVDGLRPENAGLNTKVQAIAEAIILANYQFAKYKSGDDENRQKPLRSATILVAKESNSIAARDAVRLGATVARWTCAARDLQNTPSNDKTPKRLAETARRLVRPAHVSCRILDLAGIQRLKMGALLGVAQGSTNPPRFAVLEWKPEPRRAGTIVLVGKGITFDTGGISLKSSDGLDSMKFDMSGAATVLAAIGSLGELGIPLHVVGLLPLAENMPGGRAQRPGDVVRACNGKTIEVVDTDAEGRLVLADALAYALRYKPAAAIDLATLTGSVHVALGSTAAGLFSKDAGLAARIKKAAEATGERVWEMPLFKEFHDDMKSDVADLRNLGVKRGGGASQGAAFLARFAEGYPWAHLDIAGVANLKEDQPLAPKGGCGWGVRLLVQFCRDWVEQPHP